MKINTILFHWKTGRKFLYRGPSGLSYFPHYLSPLYDQFRGLSPQAHLATTKELCQDYVVVTANNEEILSLLYD